jgi:hypothetical protein
VTHIVRNLNGRCRVVEELQAWSRAPGCCVGVEKVDARSEGFALVLP